MRAWSVALLLLLAAVVGVPLGAADDPDPPVFKGVSLEPGPYGPGDEVPVVAHWEDASGIAQVYLSVIGPGGLRINWVDCDDPQGERVAVVDCKVHLPEQAPGGLYTIDSVQANDVVGHYAWANPAATFTVDSPYNDREGPALTSVTQNLTRIDMHTVTSQWGQVAIAGAFNLTATDASKVTQAYLGFEGPNGNRGLWVQCNEATPSVAGTLVCTLYADAEIPAGDYALVDLYVSDAIGYYSFYHAVWSGGQTRDLKSIVPTPYRVTVDSPHTDADDPVLTGLTFPGQLHRGQPFEVRINATDATVVESVYVYFRTTRGNAGYQIGTYAACEGERDGDLQVICTGRFPDNFPLGLALVDWVNVVDQGQNWGWLRPVEVGNGYGPPESQFHDDDRFDVGTVLTPRPIEGVLEAIDAVVNEVLPGEAATLVYEVEDTVDEVSLVLADAADGSTVDVTCVDAIVTQLGTECTFQVPGDEDGVLSLVSATTVTDAVEATSTYAAGEVPLLAVTGTIPASEELPLALSGGALNTVGHDWAATFEAAKAATVRGDEGGPSSAPPAAFAEPASEMTATNPPPPPAPEIEPAPHREPVFVAPWQNATASSSPSAEPRFEIDGGPGAPPEDAPLPLTVAVLALALGFLLRRRRA